MHRLIDSYKLSETVHRVLCAAEILVTCRVAFRSEGRVLPGLLVHGLQATDCDYPAMESIAACCPTICKSTHETLNPKPCQIFDFRDQARKRENPETPMTLNLRFFGPYYRERSLNPKPLHPKP